MLTIVDKFRKFREKLKKILKILRTFKKMLTKFTVDFENVRKL